MKATLRRMGRISTDALMVKLKWTHLFFATSAAPIFSIRLNSPFDPSVGGSLATQPIGYDQWALLYTNYQCFGSSIRLTAINNLTVALQIAVYPSTQSTIKPLYVTAAATKYATNRFISGSDGGKPRVVIRKYMTPRKLIGRTLFDFDASAPIDQDPVTVFFWHIRSEDTNFVHLATDQLWQMEVTYFVRFFNRVEPVEVVPAILNA